MFAQHSHGVSFFLFFVGSAFVTLPLAPFATAGNDSSAINRRKLAECKFVEQTHRSQLPVLPSVASCFSLSSCLTVGFSLALSPPANSQGSSRSAHAVFSLLLGVSSIGVSRYCTARTGSNYVTRNQTNSRWLICAGSAWSN